MSLTQEIAETKNKLEYELKILEKQIYELETSYLQETLNSGNSYFLIFLLFFVFFGNERSIKVFFMNREHN